MISYHRGDNMYDYHINEIFDEMFEDIRKIKRETFLIEYK